MVQGPGDRAPALVSAGLAAPLLGPRAAFPVVCLSYRCLAAVWVAGVCRDNKTPSGHGLSASFPALRVLQSVCWTVSREAGR